AVIWFLPPSADFFVSNTGWNGISEFANRMKATVVDTLEEIPGSPDNTALVLIPYTEFMPAELDKISSYVSGGGTLILMDDYGHGDEVLEALGVGYSFNNSALLDPLNNDGNDKFPKIVNMNDSSLTFNVATLVFNHAVGLVNVPDTEVVARSSVFSFVDIDGDMLYDDDLEAQDSSAVVANSPVGEGRVIAISDPSIIINSMIDMEDNYKIMVNAVQLEHINTEVYLDQSHLPKERLSKVQSVLKTARDAAAYPVALLVIVGAVLLITLRPLWARRR
ncbi:DUF4350 domain-containing protein, partial [Chloroflexota bacterium]